MGASVRSLLMLGMAALMFVSPVVVVLQLAAINEGLHYFGVHWFIAMLLSPLLGLIPLLGTAIGSVGASKGWNVYLVIAIPMMFWPGRRAWLLSAWGWARRRT